MKMTLSKNLLLLVALQSIALAQGPIQVYLSPTTVVTQKYFGTNAPCGGLGGENGCVANLPSDTYTNTSTGDYYVCVAPKETQAPACTSVGSSSGWVKQGQGGYSTIDSNGSGITQRSTVNFIQGTNMTVSCVDNSGSLRSDCTFTASSTAATAFSALTSSTNTIAAMVCGTGCSISATGSGAITATAIPIGSVTGLGTGVATALGDNIGSAGAPIVNGGALGTPSSGTGTNITGIPLANIVNGTLNGVLYGGGTGSAPGIIAPNTSTSPTVLLQYGNGSSVTVFGWSGAPAISGANFTNVLATNIAGGAAGSLPYQTGSNATTLLPITPYSVLTTGLSVLAYQTPSANSQCFMSASSNYNVTAPSFQGACLINGGALGTPSSGNASNFTNIPITLTTTGSSGAATYTQSTNTLNIPQYSSPGVINAATQYYVPYYSASGSNTTISGAGVTGIVYVSSAAPTAATSTNVIGLWTGTCSSSTFLRGDGSCQTPSGGGNVSTSGSPAQYEITAWASGTTIEGIGPGASNAPLIGQGASAYPTFSSILYPTSLTTGFVLYGSSSTQIAAEQYVSLAQGGAAGSLTASNGGVVYSGASSLAVLAGTATADQVLLSGASSTPAWSTATYPATTSVNQILYSSSSNVIAGISTANNAVLVTSAGGVPSLSATLPSGLTIPSPTMSGTIAGTLTFSGTNAYGTPSSITLTNATGYPKGSASVFGVVETDGSTISVASGVISCTTTTTSQIGCVKPDGTTVTISAGVISAVSGAGTVTVVSSGTLTSTDCVTGGGSQTVQTPSNNCTVDSSGNLKANSVSTGSSAPSAPTGGTAGVIVLGEGTAPTGNCVVSAIDCIYALSSSHQVMLSLNNVAAAPLVQGPTSGTSGDVISFNGTNGSVIQDAGFLASNIVRKDTTNAGAAAMTLNMSATTTADGFRTAYIAGATSGATGSFIEDSTNKNYHIYANGADSIIAPFVVSSLPSNGDCIQATVNASNYLLSDAGAKCVTGSAYQTVESNATSVTQRSVVNFISGSNATVSCVDNSGASRSDCTISASSSAGSRLDQITSATGANTIQSGDNAQIWQWLLTTSGKSAYTFTEPSASSAAGTPWLVNVNTISASTVNPLIITAQGTANGVAILKSSFLTSEGTGGIDSNMLFCDVTTSTKCIKNVLSGITASNTRNITWPDAAITVAGVNFAETFSALQTFGANASIAATAHGVLLSENTSAVVATAVGATNAPLIGQTGADPIFSTILYPSSLTSGGILGATSTTQIASSAAWAAGGIGYGLGAGSVPVATAAGTAKQIVLSGGSGAPTMIDFPERFFVPAANCNNTTAGAGWSIGSSGVVACRAGTNNFGGTIAITDTSGTFATLQLPLPEDWDTASAGYPYVRFYVASTDTTSGHTIIPAIQVACYKGDGSTTDDVAPNAAHSSSTITLNTTNHQFWSSSNVQMNATDVTGCVAGALMQISIERATDTATQAAFYGFEITMPRLLVVQAN